MHDPDLDELTAVLAGGPADLGGRRRPRSGTWGVDGTAADQQLAGHYGSRHDTPAAWTIYREDRVTGRRTAMTAYVAVLLVWCWFVGIPNDPAGILLWIWLRACSSRRSVTSTSGGTGGRSC